MRILLALPCALIACATTEPMAASAPPAGPTRLQAVSVPEAAPRQPPPFDAKGFAAEQLTPIECEKSARNLHQFNADQGWAALGACIQRTRWPRGEFTHLELLTAGAWDQDLQTRADAPRLVAKVVALRGGDVEGDLPLLQRSRVPVFTLAAALRQPEVYKGRWVLLRGALSEVRQEGAKTALVMRETSLRATAREVQVGSISRYESSSKGGAQGEFSSSTRSSSTGKTDYRASGSGQYTSSGRSEHSTVKQKFENERVETGRRAVGKMPQADPFLEPEKDFLFLARFDGVSPSHDDQPVALLTVAGYYQPNALLIQ